MLDILLYVFTVFLCFAVDSKVKNPTIKKLCIVWIFVFFCFGYMTGSDWRQYERDYENDFYEWYTLRLEYGSYYVFKFFKNIGCDFWIFTGLFKILYLLSVVSLAGFFTEKKWSVVGMYAIVDVFLFVIIECPFRFMLSLTAVNFALLLLLKKRYAYALMLSFISVTFHSSFIICVLLLIACLVLKKRILSVHKNFLIPAYVAVYILILGTPFFDFIYSELVPLMGQAELAEHYNNEDMGNLWSLGNLKMFIFFILIVLYKKEILTMKAGDLLYPMALTAAFLFPIMKCIPVGQRLLIPLNIFTVLSFTQILLTHITNDVRQKVFRAAFCFSILAGVVNIYNKYTYIPYSNSIPYIINGHKTFGERNNYNRVEYQKRTGKTIVSDSERD